MKLNSHGEMLLCQLLNVLDKVAYHGVQMGEWDGKPFESLDSDDYPNPADIPDSVAVLMGRSIEGTTTVLPTALLIDIWYILAGDGTMPGLEDYVSGNYRED